jgi:hypothetical protein
MDRQELFIDNNIVELTDDVAVALNFLIADIAEPENRKADYSKTINLPGSEKINKLFSHIYNVNIDLTHSSASFNPNIRVSASYAVNSVELIDGYLQLKKVNIKDGCISYEVNIFGRNANLFNDIGEALLNELDISTFNHDWTLQNEQDSWATSIIEGGVSVPFSLGNGYTYSMIDYGYSEDKDEWQVTEFFPSVYAKTYVDKIFAAAGYEYNSTFFDSTYFKSLIIPSDGELKLTETQIEDRKCIINTTTVNTLLRTSISSELIPLYPPVDFDTVVQDNLNQSGIPPSSNTITINQSGEYNVIGESNFNALFLCNTPIVPVNAVCKAQIGLELLHNGATVNEYRMAIKPINPFTTSYTTAINPTPPSAEYDPGSFNPASVVIVSRNSIQLAAGDTIQLRVSYVLLEDGVVINPNDLFEDAATPGTFYTGEVELNIRASDLRLIPVPGNLYEGNAINMNNVIPEKIKQREFLKSIINMHNLYIQPQRENPKVLDIEPRDDFYTTEVVDWSGKLDTLNDILIEPLGALKFRDFEFSYKADKDYYNALYEDTYDEVYGYRRVILDNEFLKGTKKVELSFSPTPLIGDFDNDRIYPEIFKTDSNNNKVQTAHNTRILYYGGLLSTNNSWVHQSNLVANVTRIDYAYSGHLDNPYLPSLDINFGLTREVYYTGNYGTTYITIAGLVNRYYFNYINEISNENSKIVTAYFNLNAVDINELSFKKQYYFNGSYYRLQQVIDYNPVDKQLTKCVFIKLADIVDFADVSSVLNGGIGDVTGGVDTETKPTFDQPFKDNNTR